MLKSLFTMAFVMLGLVSVTANAEMPAMADKKPAVAIFYADWCGSCKVLDPKMKEAMGQMENKDALDVVMFDLTDDTTKAKTADLAASKGLSDVYQEFGPKTGFALLVDPKGHNNPIKITKTDSVEVIKAKLEMFAQLHS